MQKLDKKQLFLIGLFILAIVIGITYKNGQKNSYTIVETTTKVSSNQTVNFNSIQVHLAGEVYNPGIYTIQESTKTFELIKMAGGAKETADLNKTNLVQILKDGQRVLIKSKIKSTKKSSTPASKVNLNTATVEELTTLPKIGEKTAQLIINYRKEKGRINSPEDLLNIKGIGEKTLARIKPYIQ